MAQVLLYEQRTLAAGTSKAVPKKTGRNAARTQTRISLAGNISAVMTVRSALVVSVAMFSAKRQFRL